jgi:hypothetical protein
LLGGQVVGGETGPQALRPVQSRAGEGEEGADAVRQARQIPAGADIGEQADGAFGHGEEGVLRGDAVAAGEGEADAAAHRHPVHEGHDGLGAGEQQVVHPVLGEEEGAACCAAILEGGAADHCDISAGAETARFRGVVEDDGFDGGVVAPSEQGGGDRLTHLHRQGVERLGAG